MPKALYRLLRSDVVGRDQNPFAMIQTATDASAVVTSRQTAKYLLCRTCENVLSAGGEKYVVTHCLKQDGSFGLRDLVRQGTPVFSSRSETAYHVTSIPSINQKALLHFAAGVFWRASVTSWNTPVGGAILRNPLGQYEEAFRQFLIGDGLFPATARLMIWMCGEPDPPYIVTFPDAVRASGHHAHRFMVPGLCFHLLVGRVLPADVRAIWGRRADEVPVLVHHRRNDGVHQDVFGTVRSSTKALIRRATKSRAV